MNGADLVSTYFIYVRDVAEAVTTDYVRKGLEPSVVSFRRLSRPAALTIK